MKSFVLVLLLAFAPVVSAGNEDSITLHDGKVTMSLHTFKQIVATLKTQQQTIHDLSKEVNDDEQDSVDTEDCVRTHIDQPLEIGKCFGDKEL